ncbi:MAG: hypothetical protein M0P57_15035 [Syntrophales bacterium]|jgi:DNA-binding CsgD family transcriptional regulator|nr:hypothetical protein [Syntrophales bacterium]MDY0044422.1 hypothetical protein [Syntrophales bacterium]
MSNICGKKVLIPPLPSHVQKIVNQPIHINYDINSVIAKETINKRRSKWETGLLSSSELVEFYDAINMLVVLARHKDDARVLNNKNCVSFLMDMVRPGIVKVTQDFIKNFDLFNDQDDWHQRAELIVRTIIFGDQIHHPSRKGVIEDHLIDSQASEDRHLELNDKHLKIHWEKVKSTIEMDDNPELEDLLKSTYLGGNDVSRYFNDKFLKSKQGFDPFYLSSEEWNLIDDYELIDLTYEMFNNGELLEIKTRVELTDHIKKIIKREPEEVFNKISKIPDRKINLPGYLFTQKRLYYALKDLKDFLEGGDIPKGKRESLAHENDKGEEALGVLDKTDKREEIISMLRNYLTDREYEVIRSFLEGLKEYEIAAKLNLTGGRVSQLFHNGCKKLSREEEDVREIFGELIELSEHSIVRRVTRSRKKPV